MMPHVEGETEKKNHNSTNQLTSLSFFFFQAPLACLGKFLKIHINSPKNFKLHVNVDNYQRSVMI